MFSYTIIEELNHSPVNNSRVLRIRDTKTSQNYVLKLVWPLSNALSATMFNREISSLYTLNDYSTIVKIITHETGTFEEYDNCGAIVLEYIEGKNLEQTDTLSMNLLLKYNICYQIIQAIQSAHNSGILHRDIKPTNIMFTCKTNDIKVIDFGISKIKNEIDNATTSGLFSPNYSAPEVVRGKVATEKSDIYSVGAVIYKILLNITPDNPSSIHSNIDSCNLSVELKQLLHLMLLENPDERLDDFNIALSIFDKLIVDIQSKSCIMQFYITSKIYEDLRIGNNIEADCTMAKLLNLTLPKEFSQVNAYYNEIDDTFSFIGRHFIMDCSPQAKDILKVEKIHTLPPETIHRLKSKYMDVDLRVKFGNILPALSGSIGLHNLKIMLKNHNQELTSDRAIKDKFSNLFSKWRAYLNDCIESIQSKTPFFKYKSYEFEGRNVIFEIEDYQGRNIDDLNDSIQFLIGNYRINNKTFSIRATFLRIEIDIGVTKVVACIGKDMPLQRAKNLLANLDSKDKCLREDCRESISVFTKQLAAITKLEKNDYRMKGLKEILLLIQNPSVSLSISDINFANPSLDEYQKEAVKKALVSDSICLIQGPPGTGKTSVIKETIMQILALPKSQKISPKILIVSQSHTAVDNIIEGLNYDNVRVLRIGNRSKFSEIVKEKFSIDSHRNRLFASIDKNSSEFIENKLNALGLAKAQLKSNTSSDATKWLRIIKLRNEWIERKDINALEYHILSSSNIVAGTCTGYLSNDYVRELTFDYVIVDEAAKASTPELVMAILNSRKIVFVGDHYQLPPFSDSSLSPLAAELTQKDEYKLFNLLYENLQQENKQLLSKQYRMTPNIGNLISRVFYNNELSSGISAELLYHNVKMYANYSIIWHDTSLLDNHGQQRTREGGSYANSTECRIIIRILHDLSSQNVNLDVGVITGYSFQKQMIERAVESQSLRSKFMSLKVDTVDSFQGRENDIIIFSTVRTQDSIGFQKFKERVNVAFSRAKKLLIIVGDLPFMANYNDVNNKFMLIEDYLSSSPESKIIKEV